MALNDIIRTAIVGKYDGQTVIMTMHMVVDIAEGNSALTPQTIANQVQNAFELNLLVQLMTSYTYDHTEAQRVFPTLSATDFAFPAGAASGGLVGSGLPGTVACVVTKRTAFAGRNRRGRVYVPAIDEAYSNIGSITQAQANVYRDKVNATWPDVSLDAGGNASACVYSPASVPNFAQIISYVGRAVLGNQRRRRPGVGK